MKGISKNDCEISVPLIGGVGVEIFRPSEK
jgi:hypothetical protein